MASRPLRPLIPALLAGILAAAGGVAITAGETGPTAVERILQKRYLDRHFLLRADVKVQRVKTEKVMSTTVGGLPKLDETRPITVVTADGVFYASDYDSRNQLNMDVRAGPALGNVWDDPAVQNQALVDGGTVGSVIQVDRTAEVAIPEGYVTRVVGVAEVPAGVEVTLEPFQGGRVPILLRSPVAPGEEDGADARAARIDGLFRKLCFEVPEDPAARQALIDPSWPGSVQAAIRESRVEVGMTPFQVVLTWGNPVFISRDPESKVDIWLYKRGATILEQMRNPVNVYFAAGRVADIDPAGAR